MSSLRSLVLEFDRLRNPIFGFNQIILGLFIKYTSRPILIFLGLAVMILSLWSCQDKKDDPQPLEIESKQITNLHASQKRDFAFTPPKVTGEFVKFDFSTGKTTTSNTDWDIALRGTTILVNGGA